MPKISVILPTNRGPMAISTLKDLMAQRFDDYEVLVIDNGPGERVPGILDLMRESKGRLHYYIEKLPGRSRAMNKGIRHAQGDIIAFTDDDVMVAPDWLSTLNDCFEKLQCDCIGGRVLPLYPPHTPQWVKENPRQMAGTVVIHDQGDHIRQAYEGLERFIGCNCAFKKEVFKDCGLYRVDLGCGTPMGVGEDEEFYERLLRHQKKMYYCPQVVVHHPVDLKRLSLQKVSRWHIALGRFAALKEKENKDSRITFWFGVPRYLYRGLTVDFLRLVACAFDRAALHHACRSFFRKVGMVCQYRQFYKEGRLI